MPPRNGFLIRNLNLMWDSDPDDDAGGGHNPLDVDLGGDDNLPPDLDDNDAEQPGGDAAAAAAPKKLGDGLDDLFEAAPGAQEQEDPQEPSKNPSVQAVLDKVRETLPKGLHSLIIDDILAPELTKAQQGFDAQMAQMQPYRDLSKNGVSAEDAIEALRVRQFILENPDRALRDVAQIAEIRGLNPAEILGIRAAAAAPEGAATPEAGDADAALKALLGDQADQIELDPALKLVLQKIAGLEQSQQQQLTVQQQAIERAREESETRQIATAMDTLKQGFAARNIRINEGAVMQYAIAYVNSLPESQRQIDPLEALKQGARAWMQDVDSAAAARSQHRAPRLGGGAGARVAAAAPKAGTEPQSIEERKAAFLEKVKAGTFGDGGES